MVTFVCTIASWVTTCTPIHVMTNLDVVSVILIAWIIFYLLLFILHFRLTIILTTYDDMKQSFAGAAFSGRPSNILVRQLEDGKKHFITDAQKFQVKQFIYQHVNEVMVNWQIMQLEYNFFRSFQLPIRWGIRRQQEVCHAGVPFLWWC